jgi:hypothetical protein
MLANLKKFKNVFNSEYYYTDKLDFERTLCYVLVNVRQQKLFKIFGVEEGQKKKSQKLYNSIRSFQKNFQYP